MPANNRKCFGDQQNLRSQLEVCIQGDGSAGDVYKRQDTGSLEAWVEDNMLLWAKS